ncbi:hypothetical protein [Peptostreptococcus faecalis]|uniref:hypothetical protein n=1 Tax=Peptostreptococcus faecalis TaxID=2045015 RepID=UPI000C7C6686|nr:hypothetical protein [Peptostreptococcus faecalis]
MKKELIKEIILSELRKSEIDLYVLLTKTHDNKVRSTTIYVDLLNQEMEKMGYKYSKQYIIDKLILLNETKATYTISKGIERSEITGSLVELEIDKGEQNVTIYRV